MKIIYLDLIYQGMFGFLHVRKGKFVSMGLTLESGSSQHMESLMCISSQTSLCLNCVNNVFLGILRRESSLELVVRCVVLSQFAQISIFPGNFK